MLLVGQPEALREWRGRHLIDYRLVSGDADIESRWEDRIPWEGHLLGAFEAIYPRLTSGLPVPFRLDGVTRVDEGPAHIALREALVNLLVHTDYAERQASLIKRSPEGFTFRNPGSSRISEADLLTGDRSDPRNDELVRMFRYAGLADEAGTGMPKIVRAWRDLGFELPRLDVGTERYEFTIDLRYIHLLSTGDRQWLSSLGVALTEAEQLAMVVARNDGGVDNQTLRTLSGQHPTDATKVLEGLRDRSLLQMIGSRRSARYQLGAAALMQILTPGAERGSDSDSLPPSIDTLPPSIDTLPPSPKGQAPPVTTIDNAISLWTELLAISRSARESAYLDAPTRDVLLIDLCSRTPLAVRELAQLLGRSEVLIRGALRPLIETGRLAHLYPNQPRHPRQKYVAPRDEVTK